MKRLVLATTMLVALMSIGPAPAVVDKTVAVSITHVAYVPRNVTLETGDMITWTNNDTVNHQLVSQAAGIGSPILKPGDTFSFTFSKVGKFTISDALNARFQKATITVKATTPPPATLTLNASASTVRYGNVITLNGQLTSGRAGVRVDVFAQECGAGGSKRIATVTTVAGGNYSYVLRPSKTSVFMVKSGKTESTGVTVKVRPQVVLSKIRLRNFRVRAYAAESLVGHSVVFQRWVAARGRWTTVRRVVLRVRTTSVTPLPSTVVSSVSFKAKLRAGLRIRAVMTDAAAAPCYIAGSASARS
jgi:plastocyanin